MKALLCSALVSLALPPAILVQAMPTPQASADTIAARDSLTHLYGKRAASQSDVMIFKFADLLEQLEGAFYTQALAKYGSADYVAAGFSGTPASQLGLIREQEAAHSAFLQSTIMSGGGSPLSCKFNFDPILEEPASVLTLARMAEQIGTSTFSGAAHLLEDPSLLTRITTIMADEARHSSVLNTISGGAPFPAAFDVALNANEALALVGPLIDGACEAGVTANPSLAIANEGPITAGSSLHFNSTALNDSSEGLFCQIIGGNSAMAISMPLSQCIVPEEGIMGSAYIWITAGPEPLPNDAVARSKIEVVAGPVLAFVDN